MIKQVIVVRRDLKMRRGKEIAQGAHASMKVVLANMDDIYVKQWLNSSFTKVVVSCDSEEEMLSLIQKAKQARIIAAFIEDNGATEFNGVKTLTAVAIGPDRSNRIDNITGHLKLR